MTNNPNEWAIVPKDETHDMFVAMIDQYNEKYKGEFSDLPEKPRMVRSFSCMFQAALSAAPPHNFVIVDAYDWRKTCDKEALLFQAMLAIEAALLTLTYSNEGGERAFKLMNDINEKYKTFTNPPKE